MNPQKEYCDSKCRDNLYNNAMNAVTQIRLKQHLYKQARKGDVIPIDLDSDFIKDAERLGLFDANNRNPEDVRQFMSENMDKIRRFQERQQLFVIDLGNDVKKADTADQVDDLNDFSDHIREVKNDPGSYLSADLTDRPRQHVKQQNIIAIGDEIHSLVLYVVVRIFLKRLEHLMMRVH